MALATVALAAAVAVAGCGSSKTVTTTVTSAASSATSAATSSTPSTTSATTTQHVRAPHPPRLRCAPRARSRCAFSVSRAPPAMARSASPCATRARAHATRSATRACCSSTRPVSRCRRSRPARPTTSSATRRRSGSTSRPGDSVSFRLGVTHGINGTQGCTTAYGLQVIPPERHRTRSGRRSPAARIECRTATVSPLRPGTQRLSVSRRRRSAGAVEPAAARVEHVLISAGATGGENRKPCASWQPSAASASACSSVSTPSPTTSSDSACDIAMIASVIAVSRGSMPEAVDERAIDLERVERQVGEVAERRVPGAEVVEHEPHAERLQRVQRLGERRRRRASITLSVISRLRQLGSSPVRARAPRRRSRRARAWRPGSATG